MDWVLNRFGWPNRNIVGERVGMYHVACAAFSWLSCLKRGKDWAPFYFSALAEDTERKKPLHFLVCFLGDTQGEREGSSLLVLHRATPRWRWWWQCHDEGARLGRRMLLLVTWKDVDAAACHWQGLWQWREHQWWSCGVRLTSFWDEARYIVFRAATEMLLIIYACKIN